MASSKLLNLTLILSLINFLLLSFHSHATSSSHIEDDDEEESEYVLDNPILVNFRLRRMSSVPVVRIKKSTHCDSFNNHMCNVILANNGTSLLHCCKNNCRNVLGDGNNCGSCGKRCNFGERCCHGTCTNVFHNVNHCGKCNKKCLHGDKCEYGYCGYA